MAFIFLVAALILLRPLAFLGDAAKVLVVLAAIVGFILGPTILKNDN